MPVTNLNDNFEVEGIRLDTDNREFMLALDYALNTNQSFYLTGKAGSGKTTFLKFLREISNKQKVILAPTGVAAVNAGGQTIHSFFGIEPSVYTPDDWRLQTHSREGGKAPFFQHFRYSEEQQKILRRLELLVIDEISMVRADLLDVVDTILRVYRRNNLPFGGIQVIFIGDAFQLPPVVKDEVKDIIHQFYDSEFFFSSRVFQRVKPLYIELKKIYRQNEKDFIDLLNRVRVNQMLPDDFHALSNRYNPNFEPRSVDHYIVLGTTNNSVNKVNSDKLNMLTSPLVTYSAIIVDDFPEERRPTDTDLQLKVGAQVMLLRNDWERNLYNGMIGTVSSTAMDTVTIVVENMFGQQKKVTITPETWENVVYSWNAQEKCIEKEVVGTFTQFPLRLAWAITVHKSQGLTFEKVVADVGNSFASGQVYVALSRCTSMNGLVLTSPITRGSVRTDSRVLRFAQNETPETLLTEQLSGSKADYYYSESRKAFRSRKIGEALDFFLTALRYRNDLQTKDFKRYVSFWMNKLFKAEKEEARLLEELKGLNRDLEKKNNEISDLQSKLEQSIDNEIAAKKTNQEQQIVIENQNKDIRKAKNLCSSLEKEAALLKKTITLKEISISSMSKDLEGLRKTNLIQSSEISNMKSTLEQRERLIQQLNRQIDKLKEDISYRDSEIKRIASITWLQKLFGKK